MALKDLWLKIKESIFSIVPIVAIVVILSFTPMLDLSGVELAAFLISSVFLIVGMGLFNLGADFAMSPMGDHIGSGLTKSKNLFLLLSVAFAMGMLITVAEPDLTVLAEQVGSAINGTLLIFTVGAGVGLFLLLAVLKIVFKKSLSALLLFFGRINRSLTLVCDAHHSASSTAISASTSTPATAMGSSPTPVSTE